MDLNELLGWQSPADFVRNHFLKFPFVAAHGCRALVERFGWPDIDDMLTHPAVDWLVTYEGRVEPFERCPAPEVAHRLLAAGRAIRLRHTHRICDKSRVISDAFHNTFCGEIDCHVYCTGPQSMGLNWHYDAEDVFILQTLGNKEYALRKNTVHPWPLVDTIPQDMQYERESMPVMKCRLQAGDWLYIPAGYWHATHADELSVSISVGLLAPTALDLLDYIRRDLKHDIRWRQRLPQHLLQPLVGSGAGLAAQEDSLPPTSQHDNPAASEQITQWRDLTLGLASDLVRRITCGNLPQALAADLAARFTPPDTPSPAPAHDERDHAD